VYYIRTGSFYKYPPAKNDDAKGGDMTVETTGKPLIGEEAVGFLFSAKHSSGARITLFVVEDAWEW
jgi:hypothetical protein